MTSPFRNQQFYSRRPLPDNLVGPVKPRIRTGHRRIATETQTIANSSPAIDAEYRSPNTISLTHSSFQGCSVDSSIPEQIRAVGQENLSRTSTPSLNESVQANDADQVQTISFSHYKTSAHRLERCRINQKRYRIRQRAIQLIVNQVSKEIDILKLKLRDLSDQGKEKRSLCTVVIDTFKLLEVYLRVLEFKGNARFNTIHADSRQILAALRNSFVLNVKLGSLCGMEPLMGKLQKFPQYFDNPTIQVEKVEEVLTGVVAATARLQVTVSVYTLCSVFPHLLEASRVGNDTQPLLGKRLLGQRLNCTCMVNFIFDDKSGRVARLEIAVDWIAALFGVLGNLEDVSSVLDGALIGS